MMKEALRMAAAEIVGIDVGSVSVKMVELDSSGKIISSSYKRHYGQPLQASLAALGGVTPGARLVVTGSAGKLLASILGLAHLNEVIALAAAVGRYFPDVRTVIEMGGEDSKLLVLEKGRLKDFSMNSACAAGTGSFLDQQAERLNIKIEDEFGALALKSANPPRIAGRCSVFAKSDMIHLQQLATPDYDIVAGLCFAVARNFKSTIGRGKKMDPPMLFAGGVAANAGMVRAFREVMEAEGAGNFIVPEHFFVLPAAGAALLSMERGTVSVFSGVDRLAAHLDMTRYKGEGLAPLLADDEFLCRCSPLSEVHEAPASGRVDAYLGIDIGSISTNVVVIDEDKRVLSKRYLMTAGRPIEAVRRGLREVGAEVGGKVNILGVGTTGSGRYMIADFVGADIVKNEITAQATAAADIDPAVDTIFEIGGQDSKFIGLRNGVVVDFEMNKVCAAGTGSFLEEQADKLDINIKGQFGEMSLNSKCPISLGERCTVFMESALVSHQQKGAPKEDLVAGLGYSIVYNYLNRVVGDHKVGERIFFQGGVAFNRGVAAAFERVTGKKITVPPHHDVTGAIGMAIIARRHVKQTGLERSAFKGFDLGNRSYSIKSFDCKGCSNQCEIRQVTIDGEKDKLFYGSRCEKYDVKRKSARQENVLPRLFAEREKLLLAGYDPERVAGPKIGVPFALFMHEQFPFWRTFFEKLGFTVVLSAKSNKQTIRRGLEAVVAESCFPIKMAHGHILDLVERGVDKIFLPSFINLSREGDKMERGVACPYVQTMPYLASAAINGLKLIAPSINFRNGMGEMARELKAELKDYAIGVGRIKAALNAAQKAQQDFYDGALKLGEEFLASLGPDGRAIAIISRPYNGCDPGLNLDLPEKLRDLGVTAIPIDFLPLGKVDISSDWPNMYWRSGQRILQAAELVRSDPRLNALYITNYGCGPDSFLVKYFKEVMSEKPYLQLEVDEHSADAGAITRCEAFLDSLENVGRLSAGSRKISTVAYKANGKARKVWIPRMCDHAFTLAAAFKRHGIDAEATPVADSETLRLGRKHTTGKECYPCTITTGDMVKIVSAPGFDPEKAAFFMPSGTGPCRFGQYNMLHRLVLDELGFPEVPIYAPNQDEGLYKDLGMVGNSFVKAAWEGLVSVDLLLKCLHETRPYEKVKGQTEGVYQEFLRRASLAIEKGLPVEAVLREAREAFSGIQRDDRPRPLIGMVGEIYVRSNEFSNENIIRKVESLGGEVWLAPFGEWIFYQNHTNIDTARRKGRLMEYFSCLTTHFFQNKIEHRYSGIFDGFLKTVHEPSIKQTLHQALPYLRPTFQGEAILSMGKSVDFTKHGVSGVINVMPFNCMPGTIVTALLKKFSEDHGGFPYLSLSYDGNEQANAMTRLEAFVHQARERHEDSVGVAY
jgi:predicted CoA-substrate-specific enzyme activase